MSENIEDLYLKGFMAFSAKKLAEAKGHWEKVLALDPNHEKARRGLQDLQKSLPKKKSSKEILQEIKTLYARKNYPEALKLCEILIKKYPSNQDLVGLYRKIANRIQLSSDQRLAQTSGNDFENTIYFTRKAEEFVSNVAESENHHDSAQPIEQKSKQGRAATSQQVEKLIQQGVAEYGVGTLAKALGSWEKALALDSGNRIARDYIANVKAVIAKQGHSPPKPKPVRPSKEKLLEAYNQGLKYYQDKAYSKAFDRWSFILKYHPNHKETLQCLDKTKAAMEKQEQQVVRLENAREELAAGNQVAAQSILMRLSIEAPDLEGLSLLKETLEKRQQQINEIRSLELESEEDRESSFSPTDDEITQYFTPDEGVGSGARQVTRIMVPQKKEPRNKWLLLAMFFGVIGLGVGGFFGWRTYQNRVLAAKTDTFIMPSVEITWASDWQRAEDFMDMGSELVNAGDFLLATLAFQRAADLANGRLATLEKQNVADLHYDQASEMKALVGIRNQVTTQLQNSKASIANTSPITDPLAKAGIDIRNDLWLDAADTLTHALTSNQTDQAVRQKLGEIHEYLAFERLKQDEVHEALAFFKKAAVLQAGFEVSRQHVEVIQRYFNGRIADVDMDQWFFFFLD